MKLFIVLLFFAAFQVRATDIIGQTVTIRVKQTEIRKVLNAVENQTSIRFLYNYELKALKNKVDFTVIDLPVGEALNKLFQNSGLTYKKVNENLFAVISEFAEDNKYIRITGKVAGENNEPLNSVSVIEKGKTNGCITNSEGVFCITVAPGAILQTSYIGYDKAEVPISDQLVINIKLKAATTKMNEVLVVGYDKEKKSLTTGAISSIKQHQLETVSSTRVEQALQGRAAGVLVLPTSGQPGAAVNMRIRGAGSNRNSNPLFIVDGTQGKWN